MIDQGVLEEKMFEYDDNIRVYCLGWGQMNPGVHFVFFININIQSYCPFFNKIYQLNHILSFHYSKA